MAWLSVALVAFVAAIPTTLAVTSTTNTPTADSNYMVMQGDFEYMSGAPSTFGAVSGRAQLLRSALEAKSTFSVGLKIENDVSQTLNVILRRHQCDVLSSTPYQDPYKCGGYNPILDLNACNSDPDGSDGIPHEVSFSCVTSNNECVASFEWGLYIPEEFAGQRISDFSIQLSTTGGQGVFCANLRAERDLSASAFFQENGFGTLALGGLQKDELGYTRVSFVGLNMIPDFTYSAFVGDGPCDTSIFDAPTEISGLSTTFTSDNLGFASDVSFTSNSIAGPLTQSLVVLGCESAAGVNDPTGTCAHDEPVIMCYDLELVEPSTRAGVDTASSSCSNWADLYQGYGKSGKSSKKSSKSSGKKSGKKGSSYSFGDFEDRDIDGITRCCLSNEYVISSSKKGGRVAKMAAMYGGSAIAGSSTVFAGLGAGIAGAFVLAVGVILHIRRTRYLSESTEYSEVSEVTPLTTGPIAVATVASATSENMHHEIHDAAPETREL